jgi:hypothetical protein
MIDEHNHHGLSLRKALAYTDCSRNFYYYKKKRPRIARCQQQDQTILEKTKEIDPGSRSKNSPSSVIELKRR